MDDKHQENDGNWQERSNNTCKKLVQFKKKIFKKLNMIYLIFIFSYQIWTKPMGNKWIIDGAFQSPKTPKCSANMILLEIDFKNYNK